MRLRVTEKATAQLQTRILRLANRPRALALGLGAAGVVLVIGLWRAPGQPASSPGESVPSDTPWFARIIAEGVEVRTKPNGGGVRITSTTGEIDQFVLVLETRVIAGQEWLRIQIASPRGSGKYGWIPAVAHTPTPAATDLAPTVLPAQPDCTALDRGDLAAIAVQPPAVQLACLGSRTFDLGPVIVQEGPWSEPVDGSPEWLAQISGLWAFRALSGETSDPPLAVHKDPALDAIPTGVLVRLIGHFDDSRSTTCRRSTDQPEFAVGTPSEQILWCRQQFVITAFHEIAGASPSPSPSSLGSLDVTWGSIPAAPIQTRQSHGAVWTGREVIVWGGEVSADGPVASTGARDGAAYDPVSRTWSILPPAPIDGRALPSAVWTGREMIVWGGWQVEGWERLADGAAYDPDRGSWRTLPAAPLPGMGGYAVAWTGETMIVIDGVPEAGEPTEVHVAEYRPLTNTWSRLPGLVIPPARYVNAVASGQSVFLVVSPVHGRAVLWELRNGSEWHQLSEPLFDGANAAGVAIVLGGWLLIPTTGMPTGDGSIADQLFALDLETMAWSSTVVPGGIHGQVVAGGSRLYVLPDVAYDPATDAWWRLLALPTPTRVDEILAWTGRSFVGWGGYLGRTPYDPPPAGIEMTPSAGP